MAERSPLDDAAKRYLDSDLCVLPARRAEKRPAIGAWKQYQQRRPTPAELSAWLAPRNGPDALCIICGAVSLNAEMIDFDGQGELFDAWWQRIPEPLRERLVIEITPSGGYHVVYRCETAVCGNLKLAQRKVGGKVITLIETRGEGGLFLCAPTEGYILAHGDLADLAVLTEAERDTLLQAAWELNEYVPPVLDGPRPRDRPQPAHGGHVSRGADSGGGSGGGDRPGDEFNARGDVREVLAAHGWVWVKGGGAGGNEYWRRPGKESGTSATLKDGVFYVFSSNAAPFEPNRAYSPFAVVAYLEHGGDFSAASRALSAQGFSGSQADDVELSMIVSPAVPPPRSAGPPDPGPMPDTLLYMPGFVGEMIDFCMKAAPYPQRAMAFCGGLAMQAHLCGRKVRDASDLRTNIYLLALASSGAGKNYPRQMNDHLAIQAGIIQTMQRSFASGEGIEDRVLSHPATLYQTDEIDGILQSVARTKDARHESIISRLLEFYTASAMSYSMRSKASANSDGTIIQPHLTLFGTATPRHFYEALSERMLTNGFFARMIIVDAGKRPKGQDPMRCDQMPERLVETAKWWAKFEPGEYRGNLLGFYPRPVTIEYSTDAMKAAADFRDAADEEYSLAEDRGDEVAMAVWARANENARKLALVYACSENRESPVISGEGVAWAVAFTSHQIRRMLFLASQHVADTEFESECLKLLRKLAAAPDHTLPHSLLLKRMKIGAKSFTDLVTTLVERGDIEATSDGTSGRPTRAYRLLSPSEGVKEVWG